MKIENHPQQPATAQQVEKSRQKPEAGAARKKAAAKGAARGDKVELSSALEGDLQARQAEQAQRVEKLKERVNSGKYKVDAREVAEKIISRNSRQ